MEKKEKKKLPKGITQRADGLYMGRFQYQGTVYPPIYDRKLKVVEQKLNDLRYEVTHQLYAADSKVTMDEWFEIWLKDYRGIRVKAGTKENYRDTYNARIRPTLGKMRVTAIQIDHVQRLYNQMAEKGYSQGSIRLVSVVLHGMLDQALKSGIVSKNVVTLTTLPKAKEKKDIIALSEEEQRIFMKYTEQHSRFARMYQTALSTGMRIGEIRGLRWEDVDFENNLIHVSATLKYTKENGYFDDTPKTRTSKRDIPMIGVCCEVLKKQLSEQTQKKDLAGSYWVPYDGLETLVFTQDNGKPIGKEAISRDMGHMLTGIRSEGYEIPEFTFHTLRHTFATRGLEKGIPMKVMQTLLGHATLAMTSDLYSHVLPETQAKEMQKLEEIFDNDC
ncbi:MAG: site-specific integrase [Lachnospiraceae bacterium]|nr:site-specific integrase [Lachnospiraceae bacterium]